MWIQSIRLSGFKQFHEEVEIRLKNGLNILVDFSGAGRESIVDAIRLILDPNYAKKTTFKRFIAKDSSITEPSVSLVFNNQNQGLYAFEAELEVTRYLRTSAGSVFINGTKLGTEKWSSALLDSGLVFGARDFFNLIDVEQVSRIADFSERELWQYWSTEVLQVKTIEEIIASEVNTKQMHACERDRREWQLENIRMEIETLEENLVQSKQYRKLAKEYGAIQTIEVERQKGEIEAALTDAVNELSETTRRAKAAHEAEWTSEMMLESIKDSLEDKKDAMSTMNWLVTFLEDEKRASTKVALHDIDLYMKAATKMSRSGDVKEYEKCIKGRNEAFLELHRLGQEMEMKQSLINVLNLLDDQESLREVQAKLPEEIRFHQKLLEDLSESLAVAKNFRDEIEARFHEEEAKFTALNELISTLAGNLARLEHRKRVNYAVLAGSYTSSILDTLDFAWDTEMLMIRKFRSGLDIEILNGLVEVELLALNWRASVADFDAQYLGPIFQAVQLTAGELVPPPILNILPIVVFKSKAMAKAFLEHLPKRGARYILLATDSFFQEAQVQSVVTRLPPCVQMRQLSAIFADSPLQDVIGRLLEAEMLAVEWPNLDTLQGLCEKLLKNVFTTEGDGFQLEGVLSGGGCPVGGVKAVEDMKAIVKESTRLRLLRQTLEQRREKGWTSILEVQQANADQTSALDEEIGTDQVQIRLAEAQEDRLKAVEAYFNQERLVEKYKMLIQRLEKHILDVDSICDNVEDHKASAEAQKAKLYEEIKALEGEILNASDGVRGQLKKVLEARKVLDMIIKDTRGPKDELKDIPALPLALISEKIRKTLASLQSETIEELENHVVRLQKSLTGLKQVTTLQERELASTLDTLETTKVEIHTLDLLHQRGQEKIRLLEDALATLPATSTLTPVHRARILATHHTPAARLVRMTELKAAMDGLNNHPHYRRAHDRLEALAQLKRSVEQQPQAESRLLDDLLPMMNRMCLSSVRKTADIVHQLFAALCRDERARAYVCVGESTVHDLRLPDDENAPPHASFVTFDVEALHFVVETAQNELFNESRLLAMVFLTAAVLAHNGTILVLDDPRRWLAERAVWPHVWRMIRELARTMQVIVLTGQEFVNGVEGLRNVIDLDDAVMVARTSRGERRYPQEPMLSDSFMADIL